MKTLAILIQFFLTGVKEEATLKTTSLNPPSGNNNPLAMSPSRNPLIKLREHRSLLIITISMMRSLKTISQIRRITRNKPLRRRNLIHQLKINMGDNLRTRIKDSSINSK
jgi:hypothetical protein